jgi:hypothetical protein
MLDFKIKRLDNVKFNHAELVAYYQILKHNYDHMKWQAPPGEFSDLAYSWAIQTKMKDASRPCSPYHLPTDNENDFIGNFYFFIRVHTIYKIFFDRAPIVS